MPTRVGTCSVCGGDVMGYRGAWWSVMPPPPDECSGCGARRAGEVIEMAPVRGGGRAHSFTSDRIRVGTSSSGQCGCDHCDNKVGLR